MISKSPRPGPGPPCCGSPYPGMDELVDLLLNTTCEVLKGGICHVLEGTSFSPEQGTMTVHLYQCSEVVSLRFFGDSGGQEDDLGVVVEHVLSACDLWGWVQKLQAA